MEQRDLTELFIKTHRMLHRYHLLHLRQDALGADPRHGQGRILALLKKAPDISQKELSYLLDIRQQSLGELLRKLEQNEYITREPSETDKRAMMVHLTEKGRSAPLHSSDFAPVYSCLTAEEQAALAGYLERITDRLTEELEKSGALPDGPGCGPHGQGGPHGPRGPHGPGFGPGGPHGPAQGMPGGHSCGPHGHKHGPCGPGCGPQAPGGMYPGSRLPGRADFYCL